METLWFVIVAVFWTGFFVLEGFDFGVGGLHAAVGRGERERRQAISAIGPFWDANEVWLVVAAASMFAAFPGWYATLFSALYLPFLLVLVALIVRGVGLEFAERSRAAGRRRAWMWAITTASAIIPFVLGVGLGDMVAGLPVGSDGEYTGTLADAFTAYGLWTGLTLLALCALHGAAFLALKTSGAVRERSRRLGGPLALAALAATVGFAVWSPSVLSVLAGVAVAAAGVLLRAGREGWAFTATALAMAVAVASLFADLYPDVLVSSTSSAHDLTVASAASGPYALKVMTVVAAALFPLVLLYQGWTYRVFRARVQAPTQESA